MKHDQGETTPPYSILAVHASANRLFDGRGPHKAEGESVKSQTGQNYLIQLVRPVMMNRTPEMGADLIQKFDMSGHTFNSHVVKWATLLSSQFAQRSKNFNPCSP